MNHNSEGISIKIHVRVALCTHCKEEVLEIHLGGEEALSLVSIWSSESSQSSQKMFRQSGRSYGKATQAIANNPDRFKFYMIAPIVRIEINSIQAIEVVSVIQVICDCLASISIWLSRLSEHFFEMTGTIQTIWTIIWKPGFTEQYCGPLKPKLNAATDSTGSSVLIYISVCFGDSTWIGYCMAFNITHRK